MSTVEILTYYTSFRICAGIFWLLVYIAIIWRGFKDRSLGMPMVALSANISWEAIFSFIYIPESQLLRYSSIAWFCFDLIILIQCFLYGINNTDSQLYKKIFPFLSLGTIIISFTLIFEFIPEFKDVRGAYSGYGINLMMSVLFVGMLIQRNDIRGQSIYIALFKWLGTLFAFLVSCFQFINSTNILDSNFSLVEIFMEILSAQTYPLTFFIKAIYLGIFCFDIVYILLLYGQFKYKGVNPWTRF